MFEKEAKKWVKEHTEIEYKASYGEFPKEPSATKSFKAGAEFGYNKANEWHYVKDGDLPKAYQKCYFIYSNFYGEDNKVIFSESNINVLTGVYAYVIDEETDCETMEPCFYDNINDNEIDPLEVYAWKEIVLPELPKESK